MRRHGVGITDPRELTLNIEQRGDWHLPDGRVARYAPVTAQGGHVLGRATIVLGIAFSVLLGDAFDRAPATADGPTTSFSVDLDAGTPGIQTTRTVPLNTLFSVAVWMDATQLSAFLEIDVKWHYDDVRLSSLASTLPDDWKDASILNVRGGTNAPWPAQWACSPDPSANGWTGEDDVGLATYYTACYYELSSSTFFTGQLFEFVLRCDIEGPASLTIDDTDYTLVLATNFQMHFGHKHNATVNCGSGSGDADSDGMPDVYENTRPCLNASVADGTADPDVDNLASFGEFTIGADPCDNDTDNDGCADGEEFVGMNPSFGGDRDPVVGWDFADVPSPTSTTMGTDGKPFLTAASVRNKAIALTDVGVTLAYVGRASANAYYTADGNTDGVQDGLQLDRTPSSTLGKPWRSGAPNGAVSLQDVGVVLSQVGHNCNPAP